MQQRIISILLFFTLFASAQQYRITEFQGHKILEESYVYSMVQDSLGYLWVGTSNGIFRFDGITFDYYNHDDLVNDNFVSASFYHKGKVIIGHRSGNITTIKNDVFEAVQLTQGGMSSIVQFTTDKQNRLWAVSYSDGLFNIEDPAKPIRYDFKAEKKSVKCVSFISESEILLGSDEGLFHCKLQPNGLITIVKQISSIPSVKVVSILPHKTMGYIIGTENSGVYALSPINDFISSREVITAKDFNESILSSLWLDEQEALWAATMGGGLLVVSNISGNEQHDKNLKWITQTSSPYIKCIYQDRDENIWLGNYGNGITRVSRNPFEWVSLFNKSEVDRVSAIATNNTNRWVASNSALQCYQRNKLIKTYEFELQDPLMNNISTLFTNSEKTLWVGTEGKGLYKLDVETSTFSKVHLGAGLLENTITSIDGDNEFLWIGTKKGLARLNLFSELMEWYNIRKGGLPHNVINDIYIDSEKKVWVATQSNTLVYFLENKINKIDFPAENGLSILNAITEDRAGNKWVSSHGMGVFKLVGDSILNLRESQGLYSNYCYAINSDTKGYIWVTHRGGLSRVHSNILTIRSIQEYASITSNDDFGINDCVMDNEGVLWFGSNRGLLSYNPHFENNRMLPPILNLLSVNVNEREVNLNERTKLLPGIYKIRFDFIGISLKEPEKVKYQYRLQGHDNEWSDISGIGIAEYNGIGPGKYMFEVNASSSDGITSEDSLNFPIIIRKQLWSQWWFYLVLFSFILILIYGYLKRKEYKLVQTNTNLESRVRERTHEIQRQKDEIQRQGELIRKKNLDITDSIKYALTIQSAIFPPEDILAAALPEYFLINKPKDIVSGDFCWYTKNKDEYVIAVTDCTGHGVPGAIMSMLGITLFNEVVNNLGITKSGEILEVMREKVISALNQHKKENPSYDGMNVGLCVLNNKKGKLQYSGAFHNLVHIHDGNIDVIKAERAPIGYTPLDMPSFKTHEVEFKKGDMFYLFSDGYQDQFGGDDDRKFTNRRLLSILTELYDKPMQDQKLVLEQTLSFWMQDNEQTDDIILLGFRL